MEPRARAGKNVGKMNFSHQELTQFLIAHGDARPPLPETIRVLDEIVTEFIQGVSFEATRVAQLAGRQKVKYEDFQFAMRKNPEYLGKAAENKVLREAIDKERRTFNQDDMMKAPEVVMELAAENGAGAGGSSSKKRGRGGAPKQSQQRDDEELGEADDDAEAEMDAMGNGNRKA